MKKHICQNTVITRDEIAKFTKKNSCFSFPVSNRMDYTTSCFISQKLFFALEKLLMIRTLISVLIIQDMTHDTHCKNEFCVVIKKGKIFVTSRAISISQHRIFLQWMLITNTCMTWRRGTSDANFGTTSEESVAWNTVLNRWIVPFPSVSHEHRCFDLEISSMYCRFVTIVASCRSSDRRHQTLRWKIRHK